MRIEIASDVRPTAPNVFFSVICDTFDRLIAINNVEFEMLSFVTVERWSGIAQWPELSTMVLFPISDQRSRSARMTSWSRYWMIICVLTGEIRI